MENLHAENVVAKKLKIIEMMNKVLNLWGINLAELTGNKEQFVLLTVFENIEPLFNDFVRMQIANERIAEILDCDPNSVWDRLPDNLKASLLQYKSSLRK